MNCNIIDDTNELNELNELNEDDEKKKTLLKACEEVMDLYKFEEYKMKKLELDLKSLNNKIEKLKKQKNDKIFDNLLKLKNDYRTWIKLKYVINNNDDLFKNLNELEKTEISNIPILFLSKYNYFEKLVDNLELTNLLDLINKLDLEKLYVENNFNHIDNIIKFSENYVKKSKLLHYKFDHDWDYLEETESNALY